MVCIARMAILDAAINLSTSRRHHDDCVSSNAKKMGGVVDLGASAICESVFFWPPRAWVGSDAVLDGPHSQPNYSSSIPTTHTYFLSAQGIPLG
jgi:hypothetical protein